MKEEIVVKSVKDIMELETAVVSTMGMRGTGKTYLASKLEFPENVMCIYIDVVGAFTKFMPGVIALEIDRLPTKEALNKFIDLHLQDGRVIAERKLIIDVSLLPRAEMVTVLDWVSDYLFYRGNSVKGGIRYALIADEVGEFLEQERVYYSSAFERLVRMGRNRGIAFVWMITQRPQKVNKHALALSDYYVIFKFVHNLDLGAVQEILGMSEREFSSIALELKNLRVGEYVLTDGISLFWNRRARAVVKLEDGKEVSRVEEPPIQEVPDPPKPKNSGEFIEAVEVVKKASEKGPGIVWTKDEVDKLKLLSKYLDAKQLGEIIGERSPRAVRVRASREHISIPKKSRREKAHEKKN